MDQKRAIEIANSYIDYLKKNEYKVRRAYLFGSYASGHFNEYSDIDLAIVMDKLANSFIMRVELMKIGSQFDVRIEPHPFEESEFNPSNPFANEILRKGIQVA